MFEVWVDRVPGRPRGMQVLESRKLGVDPYVSVAVRASWEPEPVIGIIRTSVRLPKFAHLRRLGVRRIFSEGGIASPPQCPYQLTQELLGELIRGDRRILPRDRQEVVWR